MTDTTDTHVPEEAESSFANRPSKDGGHVGNGKSGGNKIWMGTAVGVGSAALVAALMYAKRRK